MNSVVDITLPVFGIALLGYFATRLKFFSAEAGTGLARFVFDFAIPALLVRTFANADLPSALPINYLLSYYIPVALFYVLGMLLAAKVYGRPLAGQAITGFSCCYGNGILLGLPLVLLTFGDEASIPYFILLSMHALTLFTTVTVLLEVSRNRDANILRKVGNVLLGLLKNPILIGIVCGIALNRLHIEIPTSIDTALRYFQNAVAACSLFALGVSMTRYRIAGQLTQSIVVTITKNLGLPLIVYLSCSMVFGMSAHWTFVAVLLAAQPTGVNAYIFAERYNTAQALTTTTVFISTALSLITLPTLLYLRESGVL
ncbi:MAG: AEC family transporter [Pseudomonadota bacterium]